MKKFNMKISFKIIFLLMMFSSFSALADQKIKPLSASAQIKEINYNPNSIHHYTGYYGYQSSILFAEGESISTISMGNSNGWQLNPLGNRLFLKPIQENAETNVTIITNKRVYHFAFHSADAKGLDDPELAYEVRFKYGATSLDLNSTLNNGSNDKSKLLADISTATSLNFNYKVAGADYIKPIKIFDDGRFMYLEFRDINADLPAVFLVDSEGYEALVNFHIKDNYIVVERVSDRFTLRNGSDTACIFNEQLINNKNNQFARYIKKPKTSAKESKLS